MVFIKPPGSNRRVDPSSGLPVSRPPTAFEQITEEGEEQSHLPPRTPERRRRRPETTPETEPDPIEPNSDDKPTYQQIGQGMTNQFSPQLPESAGQGGGVAKWLTTETPEVAMLRANAPKPWQIALGMVTGTPQANIGSRMSFKAGKQLASNKAVKEAADFVFEGKMKRISERILSSSKVTTTNIAGDAAMGMVEKSLITKVTTNTITVRHALNWLKAVAATAKNPVVAFGLLASGLGSTAFSQQFAMNMQDDLESAILFAKTRSDDDPQALAELKELYDNIEWDTLSLVEKYAPLLNYPLAVLRKHRANKEIIRIEEERLLRKAETDAKKADEFTQQGLERDRLRAEAADKRQEKRNKAEDKRREERNIEYDKRKEEQNIAEDERQARKNELYDKRREEQQREEDERQAVQDAKWDERLNKDEPLDNQEEIDYEKYKKSKLNFGIL